MKKLIIIVPAIILAVGFWNLAQAARAPKSIELSQGWAFVSAAKVPDTGDVVSKIGYKTSGWYPVTVPSTVMAGLVANGVYTNDDLFMGTNLKSVPNLTKQKWWYRGEFFAPKNSGGQYWLRFKGIAYQAEIWLNEKLLDPNAEGTLVVHEYNVTGLIQPNGKNAVALKITPPAGAKNLSFTYVDWNPMPPDDNGGIWGKVLLDTSGAVELRDPFVKTVLPLPATDSADLTVYVDAENGSSKPVSGILTATISKPGYPTVTVDQPVTLAGKERREIVFDPATFPQLHVAHPALWWPFAMGRPELYDLNVSFKIGKNLSASQSIKFGIRQVTQYRTPAMNGKPYFQGFQVNGKNFLVRGGAYVWDLFMRRDTAIDETHMRYAKDMGLNAIRFEGILGNEDIYDIADREGIMLIPGFVCCSRWEQWPRWTTNNFTIACASLESQMRNMRAHPSALAWLFGSDKTPLDTDQHPVLRSYKAIAKKLHWQNGTVNSAGQDGIKMDGPYVWEPPAYWYADTSNGGAFGFCAEEGGETPPPIDSLKKFIPPGELWPMTFGTNGSYSYHAGKGEFNNIKTYNAGLENRYGAPESLSDYSEKSQLQNYEAARGQFEAMAARAYDPQTKTGTATGTIFWMMDNAWPTIHWNLYDYYFKPAGSYYGAKKANAPVHALWDYDTRKISVFNSTLNNYSNLTVSATVFNIPDLSQKYTSQRTLNVPADLPTEAFTLPEISGLSTTYFVRLQLKDASGHLIDNNLYWYSTRPDVFDFPNSDWYITPVAHYADLTGLNRLPANHNVTASATRKSDGGEDTVAITLANTDKTNVAFFMRAEVVTGKNGDEILPVVYSENYITLWPGETATITAKYATGNSGNRAISVKIQGFNVPEFFANDGRTM
jgi:exo-1,4-beta-D-glucosaminidase